jgi:hypothetical protein
MQSELVFKLLKLQARYKHMRQFETFDCAAWRISPQ